MAENKVNKKKFVRYKEGAELYSMCQSKFEDIGFINDMYAESRNDDCKYAQLATQEDFDRFQG